MFLSLPFAAGAAVTHIAGCPPQAAAALSLACAAALAACCLLNSDCRPVIGLLFFCLGGLCRCTEALTGGFPHPAVFPHAMDRMEEAISGLGFEGPHSAGIITALLTGRRSGLPRETVEVFRRSGASHILALSGLHLGIIYLFIRKLLSPIGNSRAARTLRSTLAVTLCGLYTAATGASPSTVRAFLFVLLNEMGGAIRGRRHSPLGTLAIALLIQLSVRPSLIASAGFQLSYLAMLGISLMFMPLRDWYPGRGPLKRIWDAAALSTSCQLFTAPAAWWHFRSLPGYYLITNLLALPLTEILIVGSLLCLLLAAAGICPQFLPEICGKVAQLMEFCLTVTASL